MNQDASVLKFVWRVVTMEK